MILSVGLKWARAEQNTSSSPKLSVQISKQKSNAVELEQFQLLPAPGRLFLRHPYPSPELGFHT